MSEIIRAITFSIVYGCLEARIMSQGFRTQKPKLWGQFAIYHGILLLMFATVIFPHIHYILFMWVIQDRFYFIFKKDNILDPEDWVNWKFSGFYIPGTKQWIPNLYLISLGLFGIILAIIKVGG